VCKIHTYLDEDKLFAMITPSINGRIIDVNYYIKVFVKYDGMSEFGEGECIEMPIRIIQKPHQLKTSEGITLLPADWNPKTSKPVDLKLPELPPSDPRLPGSLYYSKVMVPFLAKWPEDSILSRP
jgi:hypothetical protein